MFKKELVTLASCCEVLAAGTDFKAADIDKTVFETLAREGGEAIDEASPIVWHLKSCLKALSNITGRYDYDEAPTYADIARLVLRDWKTAGTSTYAYRAAADCFKMLAGNH